MKFWPFVIAVGKYEDYDFVVVPDVISEQSRNFWRVPSFRANQAAQDILFFDTRINNHAATCIYRTTHVCDAKSDVVVDGAGRPIFKSVGCLTFDPVDGDRSRWSDAVQAVEAKYRGVIDRFVNFRATPTAEWKPAYSTLEGWPRQLPPPPPPEPLWLMLLRFLGNALQKRAVLTCLLVLSVFLNLFLIKEVVIFKGQVAALSQKVLMSRYRGRLLRTPDDIGIDRSTRSPDTSEGKPPSDDDRPPN